MLILGIDDAGRGPVLGPMALAGVLITAEHEKKIKGKVKDSKLLTQEQRLELQDLIRKNCIGHHICLSAPVEIDEAVHGMNLNTLEAHKTAEIINSLNTGKEKIKVIVDCPSPNLIAWGNQVLKLVKNKENIELYCEHKADFNHPVVSAASILAKLAREEEIGKLKALYKEYGNIGSGYASDPVTKEFVKLHGLVLKDSGLFRKSWSTWRVLFPEPEKGQKSLMDF